MKFLKMHTCTQYNKKHEGQGKTDDGQALPQTPHAPAHLHSTSDTCKPLSTKLHWGLCSSPPTTVNHLKGAHCWSNWHSNNNQHQTLIKNCCHCLKQKTSFTFTANGLNGAVSYTFTRFCEALTGCSVTSLEGGKEALGLSGLVRDKLYLWEML